MSRNRTPSAILEARGSFDKDPKRRRVDPASQGELGDPPPYMNIRHALTADEKINAETLTDLWHEIANCVPVGVLTRADRFLVELACELMCRFRRYRTTSPHGLSSADRTSLANILAKLGCSPVDRAKVATAPEKGIDSLSEFD